MEILAQIDGNIRKKKVVVSSALSYQRTNRSSKAIKFSQSILKLDIIYIPMGKWIWNFAKKGNSLNSQMSKGKQI